MCCDKYLILSVLHNLELNLSFYITEINIKSILFKVSDFYIALWRLNLRAHACY